MRMQTRARIHNRSVIRGVGDVNVKMGMNRKVSREKKEFYDNFLIRMIDYCFTKERSVVLLL